jgi:hypothetical protein
MSRAKECSTVYVVADSLEQAMDDLRWSWAQSRRIGWAIDRGAFGREEAAKAADGTVPARLRHARLVLERDALTAVIPSDPGLAYRSTEARVRRLEHELEALEKGDGWGALRGTAVGEAAIAWKQALNEWRGCLARAEHVGLRERQQLRRQAARAAEREGPLRDAFEHLAAPERARIRRELPEAKKLLADLEAQYFAHEHFRFVHPEALRRLDRLDREIEAVAWELDVERQALDGIPPAGRRAITVDRGLGLEGPALDYGLDLGL